MPLESNQVEEDLEVKLCHILYHVPVRVNNTFGSYVGSGSDDFYQVVTMAPTTLFNPLSLVLLKKLKPPSYLEAINGQEPFFFLFIVCCFLWMSVLQRNNIWGAKSSCFAIVDSAFSLVVLTAVTMAFTVSTMASWKNEPLGSLPQDQPWLLQSQQCHSQYVAQGLHYQDQKFLQDDTILNYWNLVQADKNKLWITDKNHLPQPATSLSSLDHQIHHH
ncbi:unnamed protein product [Lactuca saligna]|uniref:Uncharacterized protein n=1 Tax=Lactuca saligna TaxID=75948 RepID=A0AA35YKA1_LACSI|nr:unnamed protein product [Lactuca saligna]